MCRCNKYVLHLLLAEIQHIGFWPHNVVKRGVCYENVCPSVCHTRELRLSSLRYRNMLYNIPWNDVYSFLRQISQFGI